MTIPSGDFTTYHATGIREDLIDVITNISPTDTWFMSTTGTGQAGNRYHEWQTDALDTPAANAQIEGDTIAATAVTATSRTGNYCQVLNKKFMITDTTEAVNKAGRNSEVTYQTDKALRSLANDIEYALLINATAVSGDSGTARQLKGVLGWLTTNVDTGTATGNATALTAANILALCNKIWAAGGKPAHIVCGGFQSMKLDTLTTSNTKFVMATGNQAIDAINVYETGFGRLAIHRSTILENASAATKGSLIILGDMGLWKKAFLRPIKKKPLPVASFSEFWGVEAELTLEARQEKGSGKMTGLAVA